MVIPPDRDCCCNEPNLYDVCYHRIIPSKVLHLDPIDPNIKIIEKQCQKGIKDHVFKCEHKIKTTELLQHKLIILKHLSKSKLEKHYSMFYYTSTLVYLLSRKVTFGQQQYLF